MFQSARLKLTAWYLLIILVISTSFSFFVYRQITFEVRRSLRAHSLRFIPQMQFNGPFPPSTELVPIEVDVDQIYEEIRQRILLQLMGINGAILVLSGMAGYVLAGKTLRPIEQMVDDQKRFIADASHELRTPLTAMKTEIEVALRDKTLQMNDAKNLLKSTLEEVNHMQTLSNYLLTLSKYQHADSGRIVMESISLHECVQKAIDRVGKQALKKHITIETHLKDVRVKGNEISITELLTILLDNAVKYSHENSRVFIGLTNTRTDARIEVKDSGIGMGKNEIPLIFNRFYRTDSSRNKANTDGYGLGLSIAKQIVEIHNGTIDVKSAQGKGTTFIIRIPKRHN